MSAAGGVKRKPCRYCAQGDKPSNGQHWIVKSVLPAKITIKACTATGAALSRAAGEDTP